MNIIYNDGKSSLANSIKLNSRNQHMRYNSYQNPNMIPNGSNSVSNKMEIQDYNENINKQQNSDKGHLSSLITRRVERPLNTLI